MKVHYTTRNGRMTFELEGDSLSEVWRQIAIVQEVFENTTCTKFNEQSDDVVFRVRMDNEENEYFELYCNGPGKLRGCKKAFGQNKKGGGLFPRHKDGDGNWLPDNGWMKWDAEQKREV